MPNLLNKLIYKETRRFFETWRHSVFLKFNGFTPADSAKIRSLAKTAGGKACVIKNTIAEIVLKDLGHASPEKLFDGSILVLFGNDPVAIAKAASAFLKETKKGESTGGIIEGKIVGAEDVKELAKLPPREVLIARTVCVIAAPLCGLATVLKANLSGLAIALGAVLKKKENETQTVKS